MNGNGPRRIKFVVAKRSAKEIGFDTPFVRPHVPYTAPKEFFDLYPAGVIVMPQVPNDEMDDIPLWGKALAYGTIDGTTGSSVCCCNESWSRAVRSAIHLPLCKAAGPLRGGQSEGSLPRSQ